MCTVSMVGDYWNNRTIPNRWPQVNDWIVSGLPGPSREEFEALKRDVEELKQLLIAAQKYDEKMGEPHCEHEDKVALIKKIAELVGVNLDEVFDK